MGSGVPSGSAAQPFDWAVASFNWVATAAGLVCEHFRTVFGACDNISIQCAIRPSRVLSFSINRLICSDAAPTRPRWGGESVGAPVLAAATMELTTADRDSRQRVELADFRDWLDETVQINDSLIDGLNIATITSARCGCVEVVAVVVASGRAGRRAVVLPVMRFVRGAGWRGTKEMARKRRANATPGGGRPRVSAITRALRLR